MSAPINSSRVRLHGEVAAFAATLPAGAVVLDAGSGSAPYRPLLDHVRYESADFGQVDKPYADRTYTCDLTAIPVEDGRFDAVILTQVLEHVPDPGGVLRELHRVLKPGGRLLYSAPLFYEEHEQPYDFFRYTRFGVRHLLTQACFRIDRLDWLEGYFGTMAYQFDTMSRAMPTGRSEYGDGVTGLVGAVLARGLRRGAAVLSRIGHRLELRTKVTAAGYPKNYVAVASKPGA